MQFWVITFLVVLCGANVFASEIPADIQSETPNQSHIIKAAMVSKPNRPQIKKSPTPSEKPNEDVTEEIEELSEDKLKINFIGEMETIRAKFEDTLLQIGRDHNLGYVEMVAANPKVDPILPGENTKITLPKKHLIPDAKQTGIVINLAEMRMYDFVTEPDNPKTYPLGIGRDGLNTPSGLTKITRKKEGPSWRPTPRMREEDPELPAVVPPGEDNPLGTHALYLGWPAYLIHGTHKPLGVGRRVKQPIKMAWIDGMLYLEAHAEDELADSFEDIGKIKEYRVPETLFSDLSDIAGDARDRLDWKKIREAVKYRQGFPVAILLDAPVEDIITEDVLMEEPIEERPKRAPRMELNG